MAGVSRLRHCALVTAALFAVLPGCGGPPGSSRAISGTSTAATATPIHLPDFAWRLVWSDDFDGTTLDPSKWGVQHESTYGDGNLELACLMNRPDNVRLADGALIITARREAPPLACGTADSRFPEGRSYSSGMISTLGLASWTTGRIEARAKLPITAGTSKGLWPAVWMRPVDRGPGEIDILEAIGSDDAGQPVNRITQTLWTTEKEKAATEVTVPGAPLAEDFHVYGVVWTPTSLTFTVDGEPTFQRTSESLRGLATTFAKPFFLRINLAVGGRWPGDPTADTVFPASMVVDWVRVYQSGA